MTQFQQLESILRELGFLGGPLTQDDERAIDALLVKLREIFA